MEKIHQSTKNTDINSDFSYEKKSFNRLLLKIAKQTKKIQTKQITSNQLILKTRLKYLLGFRIKIGISPYLLKVL